ncbi:MAG: ribose 1,5-bisphosphate isomerase, partial [Candidatus Methanofastidiosa archaeon]|nr:ribose 1,5-bisphosphate isomerase [Candidatus Methanofastidiosa archaeon]
MNEELKRIANDIESMKIRGAGRIAVAAASALRTMTMESKATSKEELIAELKSSARHLVGTRPTAVSLPNAVRYVMINGLSKDPEDLDSLK